MIPLTLEVDEEPKTTPATNGLTSASGSETFSEPPRLKCAQN
jgi:hypothetical protein